MPFEESARMADQGASLTELSGAGRPAVLGEAPLTGANSTEPLVGWT